MFQNRPTTKSNINARGDERTWPKWKCGGGFETGQKDIVNRREIVVSILSDLSSETSRHVRERRYIRRVAAAADRSADNSVAGG